MLPLAPHLFAFPVVHGSAPSTLALRRHLLERHYGCLLLPLPPQIQSACMELVEGLPVIQALVMEQDGVHAYLPADPCDAFVETMRQGLHPSQSLRFVGPERLPNPRSNYGLPDPWALESMDIKAWTLAHWPFLASRSEPIDSEDYFAAIVRNALRENTNPQDGDQLLICHITELPALQKAFAHGPKTPETTSLEMGTIHTTLWPIKPRHLYFALGEMPYFAGFFEQNRQDPFANLPDSHTLAKLLLLRTRDLLEQGGKPESKLSPARLQAALRYLQRLAAQEGQIMANLFDWITACKGTLGDRFASKLLDYARVYPFDPDSGPYLRIGVDLIRTPLQCDPVPAWNILRDAPLVFRTIKLRQDPTPEHQEAWKHSWNPNRSCSHIPEDLKIELFNQRVRKQTLKALQGARARSVPFTASLLDGLDLRTTIRQWHTGRFWVHETPPLRGKLDTIVVIFDADHDDKYPHHCTWYAEHDQESTLSFFSTDPMQELIGPGIARARYGGLSLLFPPRPTPDLFQIGEMEGSNLSEHLAYASMLYSQERLVGYIAERRPSLRLREIARRLGKHLVWTPLHQFQRETLEKLRVFHILNGTQIRSIASRYIGY